MAVSTQGSPFIGTPKGSSAQAGEEGEKPCALKVRTLRLGSSFGFVGAGRGWGWGVVYFVLLFVFPKHYKQASLVSLFNLTDV